MEYNSNEVIAIFDGCKHNRILENVIASKGGGIWFQYPTSYSEYYYSNFNLISRNIIDSNSDWGILLQPTIQNTFTENNITNNGKGVHLNAILNEFYRNNFVNNTIQVEPNGVAIWNVGSQGNYWSDYSGIDNNNDEIGDTPYIINESNQDKYPLMNPINISEILGIS